MSRQLTRNELSLARARLTDAVNLALGVELETLRVVGDNRHPVPTGAGRAVVQLRAAVATIDAELARLR